MIGQALQEVARLAHLPLWSRRYTWKCRAFRANVADQEVIVIGLPPHLSWYKAIGETQDVEWIVGHLSKA